MVPRNVKIKKHKERVANASTEKNNGETATEHSVASGSRGQGPGGTITTETVRWVETTGRD